MNAKETIKDAINIVRSRSRLQTVVIGDNTSPIKLRHDIKDQMRKEVIRELI